MNLSGFRIGALGALLATALLLCVASPSSAAVTIGNPLTSAGTPGTCPNPCTVLITSAPGVGGATAPTDGVIVRWRMRDSDGNSFRLRVVRSEPLGEWMFVSSSSPGTAVDPGIAVIDTRQPVQAGDYIAMSWNGGDSLAAATNDPDSAFEYFNSTPSNGSTLHSDSSSSSPAVQPLFNADIEPDADHDGFGDETQDQCPTVAGANAGCPPAPAAPPAPPAPVPDTTPPSLSSSAHRAKLSAGGALSFFIKSTEHATGTASGTISVPKLAKTIRFIRRRVTLTANKSTKITLKLSKKNAKLVRKALRRHKKLTAKVTLSVKDSAGNSSTKKLSLKLKR